MTFEIKRPSIPCSEEIPGGIQDGKVIEIRGSVPQGAESFAVNLCTGQDTSKCDRPLHLSVRFHEKAVVRNSLEDGSYRNEERGWSFPFATGKDFTIRIKVETPYYGIFVNGEYCWRFNHRIPLDRVNRLLIEGSVNIEKVVISRDNSLYFEVNDPSTPCLREIPGGIHVGKVIEIGGGVSDGAESFEINLCTALDFSCDRALHFSARFSTIGMRFMSGGWKGDVIRNSRKNGNWGAEERYGYFPFEFGQYFLVRIEVEADCYKIVVNGKHFCDFRHRIPVDRVRSILIDGSVHIKTLEVSATPCFREIPGGIKEGKVIEVTGSVLLGGRYRENLEWFAINLCSGQDNSCDRALVFKVCFRENAVIRNSQEKNNWGEEERDGPFPFRAVRDFIIRIEAETYCYKIAVNGYHCWQFRHRMPMDKISGLLIEGAVKLRTIEFPPQITCEPDGRRLQPVFNPPTPFTHNIPGGLTPCTKIRIVARPSVVFPQDWNINLQETSSDKANICFHLSVRHHNKSVVLNTRVGGQWQEEEKQGEDFPFEEGQDFLLLIRVKADRFVLDLDNKHWLEFNHRLSPLSRFETLNIQRDIHLHSVSFS